jgi:nitrate reductase gamma subunit
MTDAIFHFVMVPMVYIAFAVFVAGVVVRMARVLRAPRHPSTLAVFPVRRPAFLRALVDTFVLPVVRRQAPVFWVFLLLYHVAFLLLILGHLDLFPGIRLMPADSPHMLGWGAVGVALTLSALVFLFRRFRSPVRDISVLGDYLLLLLLLAAFVTGGTISWANSWNEDGFVLTKQDFGGYLELLLDFSFENPRDVLPGSHYVVVVIHVFLANLVLMVFPFSKVMHTFFALPLNRLRRG